MVGSALTKARPELARRSSRLAVPAREPEASARCQPDQRGRLRLRRPTPRPRRPSLRAAQVHSGHLAASGDPRGWVRDGAITPIQRWASMFSGWGLQNLDGTAWYHPLRLTIDSGAVGDGVANPAQSVLDVHSTDASKLPKRLRIYAFGAALGGPNVPRGRAGAGRDGRDPDRNLKLVNRQATYAHNDPNAAEPKVNAFFKRLIPFLQKISAGKEAKGRSRAQSLSTGRPLRARCRRRRWPTWSDALEALALQDRGGQAAALAAAADRGDRAVARQLALALEQARRRGCGPSRGCGPRRTRRRRGRRGRASRRRRRAARRARRGRSARSARTGRPSERQAVIPPSRKPRTRRPDRGEQLGRLELVAVGGGDDDQLDVRRDDLARPWSRSRCRRRRR